MRWQMETTFSKRHLGIWGSRRNGNGRICGDPKDDAGAFGPVLAGEALRAHQRMVRGEEASRQVAWYSEPYPTFADALGLVRRELWAQETFGGSPAGTERVKVPRRSTNA